MVRRCPETALVVAISLLSLGAGCPASGPGTQKAGVSGESRAIDREVPFRVLKLVPARTVGLVVARKLGSTAEALRGFVQPFAELDRHMSVEKIGRSLRREIGVNLFDLGEVSDAGFDLNGDLAVFFAGRSLFFVLPVADEERLDKFIAEQTRSLTTYVRSYRGTVVTTWKMSYKERGALLRIGGYLVIRLTRTGRSQASSKKPKALPWLDEMLASHRSGRTIAGSPIFDWSTRVLPDRNDLLAFLDVRRANRSLNRLFDRSRTGCDGMERDLEQVRRIAAGVKLGQRDVQARFVVDLTSEAQKALRSHATTGPAMPGGVWEMAPARFAWRLDPIYLAGVVERAGRRRCGVLLEVIREFRGLARAVRRKQEQFRRWSGSGLAAALLSARRPAPGSADIRAAVIAGCRGAPCRRFFESAFSTSTSRRETIEGRPVFKVDHVLSGLTAPVRVCLKDDLMRLAVGEGVMRPLLERGEGTVPRPPTSLFTLRVQPGRIADVRALLALLERQPASMTAVSSSARRYRNQELDQLSAMLSRYALIQLDGELAPPGIRIEAEYKLR